MALSNSQYNALMREYEQQQRKDRVERDARVQEVYRRIPQIEKLDQEIAGSGQSAREWLCTETRMRARHSGENFLI